MQTREKPTDSDLRFIKQYIDDHNRDFGGDISTDKKSLERYHYQICKNCNGVEEEYYYAMKQYFTG